jgi:hypothetical protein
VIAGEIGSGSFGYTTIGEQVEMAQRVVLLLYDERKLPTVLRSDNIMCVPSWLSWHAELDVCQQFSGKSDFRSALLNRERGGGKCRIDSSDAICSTSTGKAAYSIPVYLTALCSLTPATTAAVPTPGGRGWQSDRYRGSQSTCGRWHAIGCSSAVSAPSNSGARHYADQNDPALRRSPAVQSC